jgi:hypothetical protein
MKKLRNERIYSLIILSFVSILFLSSLLLFQNCSSGGAGTTSPTITSSSPSDGATKVSVLASVVIVFSESLDNDTVNAAK